MVYTVNRTDGDKHCNSYAKTSGNRHTVKNNVCISSFGLSQARLFTAWCTSDPPMMRMHSFCYD